MTPLSLTAQLEKARAGELRLAEFVTYGEAVSVLLDAEETTETHASFVARWQAAGSPRDPGHPATEDLLAVHVEAQHYREKLTRVLATRRAEIEREVAKHWPAQGRAVVVVHARLARLERRPLRLPLALQASSQDGGVSPSERRNTSRRVQARNGGNERPQACTGGRSHHDEATAFALKAS